MVNNKNNSNYSNNLNDFIIGISISIIIPILSWFINILKIEVPFSISSIEKIHINNPSLWFIDFTPIIVGFVIYFYQKKLNANKLKFKEILDKRNHHINKNANYAKQIGEGNYNIEFNDIEENDVLGKSLIVMRDNLVSNNRKEKEQNWIAEGKDIISDILRKHNQIDKLAYEVIVKLTKYIDVIQGSFYIFEEEDKKLINIATYAYNRKRYVNQEFIIGQGLIGQCAYEKDIIYRTEIPENYVSITSGILGDKKPNSLLIIPLITEEKLQGIIEFASIDKLIPNLTIDFLKELGEIIARTLYNLKMNNKTENLLQESQQMTHELKENEEELRQNAEEMRSTQEELEISNKNLETQIKEVGLAQKRLYSLLENASEIISIYDKELKLTYQSPSVQKILGYSTEEMKNGKDLDRLTAKGEAAMSEMFEKLINNPSESITIQYTYIKKNGKKIYIETTGKNLLHDPAINGILLNSQDITERKRAEKEERMKSKMQALSENSPDLIIRLNTKGQFFYANPIINTYLGLNPQDLINIHINEVGINEELLIFFKETIKNVRKTNQKIIKELAFETAAKENRIMTFNAIPEFNENELETILFVGHDITEAKKIELEIKDKNRKINESINYSQRIQSSILPSTAIIQEYLPKSFIFYLPRDKVSGDFPWFFKKNDILYVSAVDCTGHGVPGALLSFIGYFQLNNIVDHDREYTAGQILDNLHYGVRTTLKQDRVDAKARDGMDIALCKINLKKNNLQYSGAHRPLYLLRNGELTQYKGNRKAIGGIPHKKKAEKDFVTHDIKIIKGDKIFFFSDGLPDQIGGTEGKKYSPRRIREIILENKDLSMQQFSNFFSNDFDKWKKDKKQIDDVLLIGIEF